MKARMSGYCGVCRKEYPAGTEITKHPSTGKWVHAGCAPAGRAHPASAPASGPGWRLGTATMFRQQYLSLSLAWEYPQREAVVTAVKNLTGRRWDGEEKRWLVPYDQVLHLARLVEQVDAGLAEALRTRPELATAREKSESRETSLVQSRAAASTFHVPVPEGLALYPFQVAGVEFASRKSAILFGDEMGLGKSPESLCTLNVRAERGLLQGRVLVICPAGLRINWVREIERWLVPARKVASIETRKAQDWPGPDEAGVVVINYDNVHAHAGAISSEHWAAVILDEIHYIKSSDSQRARALLGTWDKDAKQWIGRVHADVIMGLSGTPIPNRPIELWNVVQLLDPEGLGRSWKYFALRYCDAHQKKAGRRLVWDTSGSANLGELQDRLRGSIMIRRLKDQVLTELPPKRRQVIPLPSPGAVIRDEGDALAATLARLEALAVAVELAKADVDPEAYRKAAAALDIGWRHAFQEMADVRHRTGLQKVSDATSYVATLLDEDPQRKVVVWTYHRDVAEGIAEGLESYGALLAHGDHSIAERQAAVDQLQNDPTRRVIVCTIASMKEGHTMTKANLAVFVEQWWVPGDMNQAEDRIHRISQKDSVLILHLVYDGSIDAYIIHELIKKQDVITAALDDPGAQVDDVKLLNLILGMAKPKPPEPAQVPLDEQVDWEEHDKPATVRVSPEQVAKEAKELTPEQVTAIHEGLRRLAGTCDGAVRRDDVGYNRFDSRLGKDLAGRASLTPGQAVLGQKLVRKYRRQLPSELLEVALGPEGAKGKKAKPVQEGLGVSVA